MYYCAIFSTWIFEDGAFKLNKRVYPKSSELRMNQIHISVDEAKQLVRNSHNVCVADIHNDDMRHELLYSKKDYSINELIKLRFRPVAISDTHLFLAAADLINTNIVYLYIFDTSVCVDPDVAYKDNVRNITFASTLCLGDTEELNHDFRFLNARCEYDTFLLNIEAVKSWLISQGEHWGDYTYPPSPAIVIKHKCTDLLEYSGG